MRTVIRFVRKLTLVALGGPALAVAGPQLASAQGLTLEISAPEPSRSRLEGQLVDLPGLEVLSLNRPDAELETLAQGAADVCLFLRLGEHIELGLIDLGLIAADGLIEHARFRDVEHSATIETAALTARRWLRARLRRVERPRPPPRDAPEADQTPAPQVAPAVLADANAAEDTTLHFWISGGFRLGLDGSDEVSHGPQLALGLGDPTLSLGVQAALGLPQAWDWGEAAIERAQVALAVLGQAQYRLHAFWTLAARARVGVVFQRRETLRVANDLSAQPVGRLAIPTAGLSGAVWLHLGPYLALALWAGADVWLMPPRYQVAGGASRSPWPVQPSFGASLRLDAAL